MEEKFNSEDLQEEYDFLELRFLPNKWQILVKDSNKSISLTRIQREFLLVLLKNANQLVSYDELRRAIWTHESEVDQRLIHTMHAAKSKLVKLFTDNKIDAAFLESIDGKGYRLNAETTHRPARHREAAATYHQLTDTAPDASLSGELFTAGESPPPEFSGRNETSVKTWKLVLGVVSTAVVVFIIWQNPFFFGKEHKDSAQINSSMEDETVSRRNDRNLERTMVPILEKAEYISQPFPQSEFFLYLKGKNINPETVRLKVTGPGCSIDNPCTVPNGALSLHGVVTETSIERAPLTLVQGEYSVWLENDVGYISNKLTIAVQDEAVEKKLTQ